MSDEESFHDFFLRTEPLLGLATTRELLAEIKARGECEHHYREEGDAMAIGAANLIDMLPGSMLDYRTVDSDRDGGV